jgi:hypothetical protein
MTVEILEPFPPNSNPFFHDAMRMGVRVGTNAYVMMYNHPDCHCEELVVVDTVTGERLAIKFGPEQAGRV